MLGLTPNLAIGAQNTFELRQGLRRAGCGARWLAPWFARPRAWQLLDVLIGITMLVVLAAGLAWRLL